MKKRDLFIVVAGIVEALLFVMTSFVRGHDLNTVTFGIYHVLWWVLTISFYIIAGVYVLTIVKQFQTLDRSDLVRFSLQFFVLGVCDYLFFVHLPIYLIDSHCFRLVIIVLIVNLVTAYMIKNHKNISI